MSSIIEEADVQQIRMAYLAISTRPTVANFLQTRTMQDYNREIWKLEPVSVG
jgi:hypothetical protein